VPSDASSDASFREESISPKLAPAGTAIRSLAPELALGNGQWGVALLLENKNQFELPFSIPTDNLNLTHKFSKVESSLRFRQV